MNSLNTYEKAERISRKYILNIYKMPIKCLQNCVQKCLKNINKMFEKLLREVPVKMDVKMPANMSGKWT